MQNVLPIIFFFLIGATKLCAQQDSTAIKYDTATLEIQKISEDELQGFRHDPKFDYEIVNTDPSWWDDFKTWANNLFLRFFEWIFGVEEAAGMLAIFLRIIPYLLLFTLLFVLIKFFLAVNSRAPLHGQYDKAFVSLSDEEHIIKNEDIEELIKRALVDKNFRLAIRYYYLFILQLMSEKEIIHWETQKTNHDYLSELEKPDLKRPFSKITRLYDYIWYGDFPIDEQKYQRAVVAFTTFQKMVQHG